MPAAHRSTALPDHLLAAASAVLACPQPLAGVRGDLRSAPGRTGTAKGSAEPLPQLFEGWNGLWPAHGEAPNPGPTALRVSAVLHPTTQHAKEWREGSSHASTAGATGDLCPGRSEPGRRAGSGPSGPARGRDHSESTGGGQRAPGQSGPLVWRCPGSECSGGLAQTRRAPGAC